MSEEARLAGRILEGVSRIMAAIDGIRREIESLTKSLEALASTVYAGCLLEKLGGGEITRLGLPQAVSFLVKSKGKVYVVFTRIIASYEFAVKARDLSKSIAESLAVEGEVVPVVVASRYKGAEIPEGVEVILC